MMRIFLVTANTGEIHKGLGFGIVDGVATDLSPIARRKREFLKDGEKVTA